MRKYGKIFPINLSEPLALGLEKASGKIGLSKAEIVRTALLSYLKDLGIDIGESNEKANQVV